MRTPRPESKGLRGTSASSPSTSLHHARGGAAGQGNTGGAGQHRAGHLSGRTHQSQASSAGAGAGLRAHRARHASWVCWLAGPRPPAPAHLTRRSLMTASCEGSTPTRRRRGRAIRSSLRAGRALAHGWSCLAARVPAMPTQRLGHGHRTTTDTRHAAPPPTCPQHNCKKLHPLDAQLPNTAGPHIHQAPPHTPPGTTHLSMPSSRANRFSSLYSGWSPCSRPLRRTSTCIRQAGTQRRREGEGRAKDRRVAGQRLGGGWEAWRAGKAWARRSWCRASCQPLLSAVPG